MLFDEVYEMMKSPNKESLNKSLMDVHHKGLFSLVVGGSENGSLTRIFYATKKIKPFTVQLHSHCYDLKLCVINGEFTHHEADYVGGMEWDVKLPTLTYQSPLNVGTGLQFNSVDNYKLSSYNIPVGGEIHLPFHKIHSVSCSKGSVWIVQEQGFSTKQSVVLGTPFTTDGLYNTPKQFQTNDVFQLVYEKVKKICDSINSL